MKKGCTLCNHNDILSGKDTLLFENDTFYIVDNGNTHLNVNGKLQFAKRRISLILTRHQATLSTDEEKSIKSALSNFVKNRFHLDEDDDYFIKSTMGTFPQHYHVHAYILPFGDVGEIISPK